MLQVTDLGAVLQLIGGTAASFMIFFLPGLLLINAAIVKHQEYEEAIDVEVIALGCRSRPFLAARARACCMYLWCGCTAA